MRCIFLLILFSSCYTLPLFGQEEDSVMILDNSETVVTSEEDIETFRELEPEHSPRLAAMYSAAIPGLGQFYNEKYWKIPIVYSLGVFAAFQIKSNHQNFMLFRNAYINIVDGNPTNDIELQRFYDRGLTTESIERRVERFKRDRDYWIILAGLFYVLNIVDATVDAHLREFNINPDLSIKVEPTLHRSPYNNMQAGLTFSLRFK
ncbi:hypothetical protein JKA74_06760 [Marivirga sp. S37H4]|uniref:DUF5683 domain-containing protein n=1 Tax=Marivirga aurantiaca TaxID=2802615 RepID=A0A935C839_9BACT|nr:DUF5683 domain-containing protein [Marivirga aurantiaca]MBK6264732.1 hypothetical protein [Marivirga aurantiaca]